MATTIPHGPRLTWGNSEGSALVSRFANQAFLVIIVMLVAIYLLRTFLLERFLLPRYYPSTYALLPPNQRRSFIIHHMSLCCKLLILLWGIFPFCALWIRPLQYSFASTFGPWLTLGDALFLGSTMFVMMYVHELLYRSDTSYVSIAHHIGTVLVFAVVVSLSSDGGRWYEMEAEYMLCMVFGVFDLIFESWPHVVIILKRVYPSNHDLLRKWNRAAFFGTLIGTITETAAVFWVYAHPDFWKRWHLTLKILTPILWAIFAAAQMWGTRGFYHMWKLNARLMRERDIEEGVNSNEKGKGEGKKSDDAEDNGSSMQDGEVATLRPSNSNLLK